MVSASGFMKEGAELSVHKVREKFYGHAHFINNTHRFQCSHAHFEVCNIKNRTFSALASLLMDYARGVGNFVTILKLCKAFLSTKLLVTFIDEN